MSDVIDQGARGPVRYEFQDGTGDLVFGVWFLFFSLVMRVSRETMSPLKWLMIFYGMGAVVWAATHFGTRAIRARLVYQRSGYIRRKMPRARVLVLFMLSTAVVSAGVAGLMVYCVKAGVPVVSAPLITGIGIGATMFIPARRARRYAVYGMLSVGLGLVLHLLVPAMVPGCCLYYLAMGTALLIGGATTLYWFVRHTPVRTAEAP
jgi:hypothetical protein